MPRVLGVAALLFVLLVPGARADAADVLWPSARGTAAGRAACVWDDPTPPPEVREWHFTSKGNRRYKMGLAVWASPALALINGRPLAFIGGYGQTMHALDLADKNELWSYITNGEIQHAPAVGLVGGRPTVFWGSADRFVYAHPVYGRRLLWSRELQAPTNTMGTAEVSAPLLHDGVLYVTCFVYDKALARNRQKGWLCALDMADGRLRWRYEVSQGPVGSPVGRMLDGRFIVFLCAQKGLLQAIDVSGPRPATRWTFQMAHEVLGEPVVDADAAEPLVFLGSKFGNFLAIDARTGQRRWERMAGDWIDNGACIAEVNGERVVFVGSHDYNVYAFRARDGAWLWRRHLGGQIYSAPSFFHLDGRPMVAVAALDNHVYVLDAADGRVDTSYFTGQPIWDKVSKGETLWGSPAALEAGSQTALVHGSFNDTVYVLPLKGEVTLRAQVQSAVDLWIGLGITLVIFVGVVLPLVLWVPRRSD